MVSAPDRPLIFLPCVNSERKAVLVQTPNTGSIATLTNSEDLKRRTVSEDPHEKVREWEKFHNSRQRKIIHFYVK